MIGRSGLVSALGHEQTSRQNVRAMSVLPLKADVLQREWHVRLMPIAELRALSIRL